MPKRQSKLDSNKKFLQIALNGTLAEAKEIINALPTSPRIIYEAGTPLIKRYGLSAITSIATWTRQKANNPIAQVMSASPGQKNAPNLWQVLYQIYKNSSVTVNNQTLQANNENKVKPESPYIIADLKMIDRGRTEAQLAFEGGAQAAVAHGGAPIESLNEFILACYDLGIDPMIDLMNIEYPISILSKLKEMPKAAILHRGVDETRFNKYKPLPLNQIKLIKSKYNIKVSVAGGDTIKEVSSAFFNDADIAVVWKNFYNNDANTSELAQQFLHQVK